MPVRATGAGAGSLLLRTLKAPRRIRVTIGVASLSGRKVERLHLDQTGRRLSRWLTLVKDPDVSVVGGDDVVFHGEG